MATSGGGRIKTYGRVAVMALAAAALLASASTVQAIAAGPHKPHASVATRSAQQVIPSIFESTLPQYAGAGWSACPTPITWTVDTRDLPPASVDAQISNLTWAFHEWSRVTGLAFAFGGAQELAYDSVNHQLTPADGTITSSRHIYVMFARSSTPGFSGNVDGLASPALVMPSTKEILQGRILLRADYFGSRTSAAGAARAIAVHEIGHALGLAHSASTRDVMYPRVDGQSTMSAVDADSARGLLQPCTG